jgi:hypothetical protein
MVNLDASMIYHGFLLVDVLRFADSRTFHNGHAPIHAANRDYVSNCKSNTTNTELRCKYSTRFVLVNILQHIQKSELRSITMCCAPSKRLYLT